MTTMKLFVVAVFIATANVDTCAQRGLMRPADIVVAILAVTLRAPGADADDVHSRRT